MNTQPSKLTVSDQTVPTPTRNRLIAIGGIIGANLENAIDDELATQPFETFVKVMSTISYLATMWLGQHDSDLKELMETLADADIQASLKKEVEAAHAKGQPILP